MDWTSFVVAISAAVVAVSSLITALRGFNKASIALGIARHANDGINTHVVRTHDEFPIQPPTETDDT